MLNNANQEQIEYQNKPVLRLIKNEPEMQKREYFLYYNSGVFPILMVIIFFLCIGVIINIGLRIQNMNYDKKIYSINQLISSEKERTDRLNLKISELKSPSRIADKVFLENEQVVSSENTDSVDLKNNTVQEGTKNIAAASGYRNFKNLDIVFSKTANDAIISSAEEDNVENIKGANLVSILKNTKNILMVVSEGILTFFIP
jgi:cell division protein FtsL